jgi:GntR family transcriptional regulator, transcriptional repressor for pyruvate dehydrogenase complex
LAPAPIALDDLLLPAGTIPTRLRDAVLDTLTEAILDGRLKAGDALPSEGRLASSFGISKQVAREAIRELAAMGVVHIQQGKPTRVRAVHAEPLGRFFRFAVRESRDGMREAVELRRVLEPPTAALAAQRRGDDDIARIGELIGRLRAALEDVPAWIEADLDFHESIAAMAGNRLLRLQCVALRPIIREILEAFNAADRSRTRRDWEATLRRHERIAEALIAGDAAAARAAMELHFEAADEAINEIFAAGGADG